MQRSFCLGRSMELKLKLGTKEDAVTSAEQIKQNIVKAVKEVRVTNPMAGSVTNTVTIDFVANAQLAVGGSAAMVYLPDEGECLVAAGGAVYSLIWVPNFLFILKRFLVRQSSFFFRETLGY